jgi:hypothetical protein
LAFFFYELLVYHTMSDHVTSPEWKEEKPIQTSTPVIQSWPGSKIQIPNHETKSPWCANPWKWLKFLITRSRSILISSIKWEGVHR